MGKKYILEEKDRDEVIELVKGSNKNPAINFLKQLKESHEDELRECLKEIKTLAKDNKNKLFIATEEINSVTTKYEKYATKN